MSDLKTLLPPSTTPTARTIETVMAERLIGLEKPITKLWNVETCPEELLPWLAWAFSVEVWEHSWPVEIKRAVIAKSINVHRWKGTRRSVEEALAAIGFEAGIREWFEFGEDEAPPVPGTFEVTQIFPEGMIPDGHALARSVDAARRVIDATKPVSAHYDLRTGLKLRATRYTSGIAFAHASNDSGAHVEKHIQATRRTRAALTAQIDNNSGVTMRLRGQRRTAGILFAVTEVR